MCCKTFLRKSTARISSLVSIFATVFVCQVKGAIFSALEKIRNSDGNISAPCGALLDGFIVPFTAMVECSLSFTIFSLISSEHTPDFTVICISPSLSFNIIKTRFPWSLTLETHPITITSFPSMEGSISVE